jgi:hypothetical protein
LLLVAFAIDIGHTTLVKSQLQNAADSAALAGGWELFDSPSKARMAVESYAENHDANGSAVSVTANEDIELGLWNSQTRVFTSLTGAAVSGANSIRVTTRLTSDRGNSMAHFFANIMGHGPRDLDAVAVCAMGDNFSGFAVPPSGGNQPILPFAIDLGSWRDLDAGVGTDNYTWDAARSQMVGGPDGIVEMDIFPSGNNAPGNRGLLEIGPNGGNVNALRDQIVDGISPSDLNHHGGSLKLDSHGRLTLSGEPGVKNTLKAELGQIVGDVRVIPIFDSVSGQGNNTTYTIKKFVTMRIARVDMQGNNKKIIVQPASISISGGIPETGTDKKSVGVYAYPILVQ